VSMCFVRLTVFLSVKTWTGLWMVVYYIVENYSSFNYCIYLIVPILPSNFVLNVCVMVDSQYIYFVFLHFITYPLVHCCFHPK
jgi:hypothetical protein